MAFDRLRVTTVEDASLLPMSRELRDARERAVGALVAAGAQTHRVSLRSWRRAALPYLTTLQASAPHATRMLLAQAGAEPPSWRAMLKRGGPHTLPTRITLAAEMLPQMSARRREKLIAAARALADGAGRGDRRRRAAPPGSSARRTAATAAPWDARGC